MKIGVVTFPIEKAGIAPLKNLLDVLRPNADEFCLVTGNEGCSCFTDQDKMSVYYIQYQSGHNLFSLVIRHLQVQLKISYIMFKVRDKADMWFFFMDGDRLLLPMIVLKLFKKKVVLIVAGSVIQSLLIKKSIPKLLVELIKISIMINYKLSYKIVLYSTNLITEWRMEKYINKIEIAHRHFVDFSKFRIIREITERKNLVGFIGRLESDKGILNFILAVQIVIKKSPNLDFIIIGEGSLQSKIKEYIKENNLQSKITLLDWVSHDKIPDYLNEMTMVILPSYTEGLPNIAIEAMACGTVVVATPVGSIPDIIHDGKTGFIIADNTPECIAYNIIRVLRKSNLKDIIDQANNLIIQEFSFERVLVKWKIFIDNLL